mgnify:CR=1 FL=1
MSIRIPAPGSRPLATLRILAPTHPGPPNPLLWIPCAPMRKRKVFRMLHPESIEGERESEASA